MLVGVQVSSRNVWMYSGYDQKYIAPYSPLIFSVAHFHLDLYSRAPYVWYLYFLVIIRTAYCPLANMSTVIHDLEGQSWPRNQSTDNLSHCTVRPDISSIPQEIFERFEEAKYNPIKTFGNPTPLYVRYVHV